MTLGNSNSAAMKDLSIKFRIHKYLLDNANRNFRKEMKDIEEEFSSHNASIWEKMLEQNSLFLLSNNVDAEMLKREREALSRSRYNTPTFMYAGDLMDLQEVEGSEIYSQKEFLSVIPFFLPIGYRGIGFINDEKYKKEIHDFLESSATRILVSLPDGLARVTVIDKNASGQSFPLMSSLHSKITENKILSDEASIEREISELKNSLSRISQTISFNGFSSIEEYNRTTQEVPQPYRIIMIANFPYGFSKKATEDLISLIDSPHGAGYYFFISFSIDTSLGESYEQVNGIPVSEFFKRMTVFKIGHTGQGKLFLKNMIKFKAELLNIQVKNEEYFKRMVNANFSINLKSIPDHEKKKIVQDLNRKIENINIKPIIFIRKTIPETMWFGDASKGVAIPFGKNGIENVYLSIGVNEIGEDTGGHHGIVCGSTGSGKTVFLHDIIMHGSMKYSPDELRFWLLDYKKGTEFAIYKDYPQVEILSMESEIEFGHEVLEKVVNELYERGKAFKIVNARNLKEYKSKRRELIEKMESPETGEEEREQIKKMLSKLPNFPRVLVIIDEFQQLYPSGKQKLKDRTNAYISQIVREGRSFGFNILLATQTLKGVDLAEDILPNIAIRIGLKMEEADVSRIFSENNEAPKFLKNPGEGIYNDQFGKVIGNVPFQAYFADEQQINEIKNIVFKMIDDKGIDRYHLEKDRVVYVGNIPGKMTEEIKEKVRNENESTDDYVIYLGEPSGLDRDMVKMTLRRSYANNIAIVGRDSIRAVSIFRSIIDQFIEKKESNRVILSAKSSSMEGYIYGAYASHPQIQEMDNKNYKKIVKEIYDLLQHRLSEGYDPKKDHDVLFAMYYINSLALFNEEMGYAAESSSKKQLEEIMRVGPENGIFVMFHSLNYTDIVNMDNTSFLSLSGKVFTTGESTNDLNVFLRSDEEIELSPSRFVAIFGDFSTESSGSSIRKFKPFIYEDMPGLKEVLERETAL